MTIEINGQTIKRVVCSFSCGAASTVATKLAIDAYADKDVEFAIVYADTGSEHPDNKRYLREVQERIFSPRKVHVLRSKKYRNIWETFSEEGFIMQMRYGAICTTELKRKPVMEFARPGDAWVIGFTTGEEHRLARMNPQTYQQGDTVFLAPCIDAGLSHSDVKGVVSGWGIELPALYRMGYRTNNCVGCVKGGIGYWQRIQQDFPEVFNRMAAIEEKINFTVLKDRRGGEYKPLPLRELANSGIKGREPVEPISCSEVCHEMLSGLINGEEG